MVSRFPERRVRTGTQERILILGIGDLALPAEGGELLLPPFPDRLDEARVAMVHEVEERSNLAVLLPHEQERQEGRKQDDARGELQGLEADQAGEPLPAHPVPHLVVVLGEHDELSRREVARRVSVPALPVCGVLPGIDEPVGERPAQVSDAAEVAVVPVPFPRQERVERVVEVVAPLRVEAVPSFVPGRDDPRVVQVALRDQVNHPALLLPEVPHGPGELGEERGGAEVHDAVDRVEAQRVDVELPQPVEGVLLEKPPDLVAEGAVEVHGGSPRSAVPVAEVGAEVGEVIPLRPEMVVNHVQDDGQAAQVACVDQALQPFRPPVALLHREREDAVVSPVSPPGELRNGHQLHGGDPQLHEGVQARDDGVEGAFGRVRPDVELVEDVRRQRDPAPFQAHPGERIGVDDHGGSVDALWLESGRRVRELLAAVQPVEVPRACLHPVDDPVVVPKVVTFQEHDTLSRREQAHLHCFCRRREHEEVAADVRKQ